MKIIKIIKDSEFNLENKEFNNPRTRIGARGIVLNEHNQIVVFNKKEKNEYKLPGGGVEEGEKPRDAFIREVLEETGLLVEIISEIGIIEEHKSHDNFIQKSYVYISKVKKDTKEMHLTQKEIDEGSCFIWLEPKEALEKISNCINDLKESKYENLYHSKFIVTRDRYILEYYLGMMV